MSECEEYKQCMTNLRYFLDYREKIFKFCITVNGGLLTVAIVHSSSAIESLFLSAFALVVTVLSFLAEVRSVKLADWFREAAIELEKELSYVKITAVHAKAKESGIGLRKAFSALYIVILLAWAVNIIVLLRAV